ncbi:hypothetical protein [Marinicrinis sediminis]|uniref:Uncharacterized protein n=1 Tax=Marinicrinis sediminis TaxID=1652465 RepID=A0ABW5RBC3_9BACL
MNQEHDVIVIDGKPLDAWLDEFYPDRVLRGLVPMILDWMVDEKEAKFVQDCFLSEKQMKLLPVLMCPDDCDFSCTVIVAEVLMDGPYVIWKRMGQLVHQKEDWHNGIESSGGEVDWFDKVPVLKFDKEMYMENLASVYTLPSHDESI